MEHVPGTAFVLDGDRKREVAQDTARNHLKYDKTGKILLVPQPSDDPNDPLVSRDLGLSLTQHPLRYECEGTYTDVDRTGHYGNETSS